ncbi:MAG: PepSY domain-containing protein [Aeromicrobium sp.]
MKKRMIIAGIGATAVLVVSAAGFAVASSSDDGDATVTGTQADKATAAALVLTKGGTANAVERDSENGATWEVEVTKENGSTVDVRLDENYRLVVIEGDREVE